jgi:DNA-binding NtrC family response regulator
LSKDVLIISTMDGVENCARLIAEQVGSKVEVAGNRRLALALLRRKQFGVVVVEESLAEAIRSGPTRCGSRPEWRCRCR